MRDSDHNRVPSGVIIGAFIVLVVILFCLGYGLRLLGVPWYVAALIIGVLAGVSTNNLLD